MNLQAAGVTFKFLTFNFHTWKPYETDFEIAPETINPYCFTYSDEHKLNICLEQDGFDQYETVCDNESYDSLELKQFQQHSSKQNNCPTMFHTSGSQASESEGVFFFDKIQRTENTILPFF